VAPSIGATSALKWQEVFSSAVISHAACPLLALSGPFAAHNESLLSAVELTSRFFSHSRNAAIYQLSSLQAVRSFGDRGLTRVN
jgi:hypothetical protein